MSFHSIPDSGFWKALRIRLFGLTAQEQAENMAELARMRVAAAKRQAEEDAEDEKWVQDNRQLFRRL